MLIAFDVEGLKQLSNLGGFPAVFLMVFFLAAWIKIVKDPMKYDEFKEDYDERGKPIPTTRLVSDDEIHRKNAKLEKKAQKAK